uniref:Uncharacterized protein n=1 Tax=Haptolina brevifila TaxID=156173 RepID=A0A7S2JJ49_9EUKA
MATAGAPHADIGAASDAGVDHVDISDADVDRVDIGSGDGVDLCVASSGDSSQSEVPSSVPSAGHGDIEPTNRKGRILSWGEGLAMAVGAASPATDSNEHSLSPPPSLPPSLATRVWEVGYRPGEGMGAFLSSAPVGLNGFGARLDEWLRGGRAASALLVLTMAGRRRGWEDGTLARGLACSAARLRLEQWPALFSIARHADAVELVRARRADTVDPADFPLCADFLPNSSPLRTAASSCTGATRDVVGKASFSTAGRAAGTDGATLLMLRAMLTVQPPATCLGVLRSQPALAEWLPPRGYVELLRAVQRHQQRGEGGTAVGDLTDSHNGYCNGYC